MAIRASTQQGPPASGGGCVSPVNNTALLVTKANAASYTSANTTYDTIMPASTIIRCTDEGVLKTFEQIVVDDGGTVPTIAGGNQIYNISGVKVKRPNCECTDMNKLRLWKSNTSSHIGMWNITFSDGYSLLLGSKWSLLKITSSGIDYVAVEDLVANTDYIVACQSYGKTTDVSSGCLLVTGKTLTAPSSGTVYMNRPETLYPQDDFPTSEIRASIMLENGAYIFAIPPGGSY